ncbi:MAG: ABC transporter substrate-binding protein [Paraglaciecola chathamensis]
MKQQLLAVLIGCLTAHAAWADRTITDSTGRNVTIPDQPSRIVVLHEPLLGVPLTDLGLAPIGSYGRTDAGESLMSVDFYHEIFGDEGPAPNGIGAIGNLDLEKLNALQPDLIIGTEYDSDKAKRLSEIAPVYLQNSSTGRVHGISPEKDLATVANLNSAFEQRLAEYHHKLAAVKAKLPQYDHPPTYLGLFLTDQVNALGEMSGAVQAMEDLGFKRLAFKEKNDRSGLGSTLIVPVSAEIIGQLNPDILIILNSYNETDRSPQQTQVSMDRILPGWKQFLTPAREGRVLYLDSGKVTTPSIASAELTLVHLEQWLENQQD